jgi:hypothetical protein
LTHDQSIERYRRVRETADADEIVDLFTPDASYRSSVFREPWEGDNAVGRDARTEHFRDTEGQAPIRSRMSRSAVAASSRQPRLAVRGRTGGTRGQPRGEPDRDRLQDPASLDEGRCGSPEITCGYSRPVPPPQTDPEESVTKGSPHAVGLEWVGAPVSCRGSGLYPGAGGGLRSLRRPYVVRGCGA